MPTRPAPVGLSCDADGCDAEFYAVPRPAPNPGATLRRQANAAGWGCCSLLDLCPRHQAAGIVYLKEDDRGR